ncbi:MAG TPA: HAMP domain-containing sensor histidine kinase [Gemmatimonadaceae bacterium]|jgi:signal transduction histidine kinase|nr:HAMP domain-containing sensor histidine kinase [Gemmatimonadaceae bacterium]
MGANIQAVDVRNAVGEVLRALEPRLVAKRLDSVADIEPGILVAADPAWLRGILLTLLSNAIQYSGPGGHVMVDVGYPIEMPADVVLLRVGDNGCGIPLERQQAIFDAPRGAEPRADAAPGLAASRAWARGMGGDLRVRSDVGHGSVFTLKLPRTGSAE